MECKSKVVIDNRWIIAVCHTRADYLHGVPWRELLNPLRYSLSLKVTKNWVSVNRSGRAWLHVSNALYAFKLKFTGKPAP